MARMSPLLCLLSAVSVYHQPVFALPSLEQVMEFVEVGKPAHHRRVVKNALQERDVAFLSDVLRVLFQTKQADTRSLFDYDGSDVFNMPGYTLMHYAAWNIKDEAKLKVLADAGADFNKPTETNVQPIHNAGQYGNAVSMAFLLKIGCNPLANSGSQMNAATMAARQGHIDVLRVMKEHGGKALMALTKRDQSKRTEGITKNNGLTPLMYAVASGKVDVMRFLIFEVGWGDASVDEVVAIAEQKARQHGKLDQSEIDNLRQLGNQHSTQFKEQREMHFMATGGKLLGTSHEEL